MITVMGATGQTGGATARRLLEAGEHVRALGRSADRLDALRDAGADPFPVDASDAMALTEAFRGANAAYVLLPISPEVPDSHAHMAELGEAIITAVRAAAVPYVVAVSSVGADLPSGTGFLTGLHAQEQRLRTLTDVAHVLAFRPGAYFENANGWLPVIAEQGVMADSVAPDAPLPMVATRDVGAAAAAALRSRDWTGFAVRELLGPRDLTYAEVARMIGAAVGRPDLPYVQVPEDDLRTQQRPGVMSSAQYLADNFHGVRWIGERPGRGAFEGPEHRGAPPVDQRGAPGQHEVGEGAVPVGVNVADGRAAAHRSVRGALESAVGRVGRRERVRAARQESRLMISEPLLNRRPSHAGGVYVQPTTGKRANRCMRSAVLSPSPAPRFTCSPLAARSPRRVRHSHRQSSRRGLRRTVPAVA